MGTFVGALVAAIIAATHKMPIVIIISSLFFLGGAFMVYLLPSPMWFNIVDLVLAYFPMGFLGIFVVSRFSRNKE